MLLAPRKLFNCSYYAFSERIKQLVLFATSRTKKGSFGFFNQAYYSLPPKCCFYVYVCFPASDCQTTSTTTLSSVNSTDAFYKLMGLDWTTGDGKVGLNVTLAGNDHISPYQPCTFEIDELPLFFLPGTGYVLKVPLEGRCFWVVWAVKLHRWIFLVVSLGEIR